MLVFKFPIPQQAAMYPLPPLLIGAAAIEFGGGLLLLAGLFTRLVAFIASGEMAVAYFMAHNPQSVWPGVNGGDAAILFCFVFLYLTFSGGGLLSLDRVYNRSTTDRSSFQSV